MSTNKMINKKEKLDRFNLYTDNIYFSDDGDLYDVIDVHEAIKKSINNESIEMIKADLDQYFGLKL